MNEPSPLQIERLNYQPKRPEVLDDLVAIDIAHYSEPTGCVGDEEQVRSLFPHLFGRSLVRLQEGGRIERRPLRIGVVLSGGQAAGGHNVIAGLFDAIKEIHSESILFGFLGGPSGIIGGKYERITLDRLAHYRNQGGFDMIGAGRTKIETEDQLAASMHTCQTLELDGLVIVGGDDSNTNAALLAEYLTAHGQHTSVVGVPKTIDGDLKGDAVEISFGHDTACKVYAELIGNLMRDALSAKKYYHFVKLMGRSASHIALECALQTHPNFTLLGEEVLEEGRTLAEITNMVADLICERADRGKNYGVVLIPEGLVEFIPEMRLLIGELNGLLAKGGNPEEGLSPEARRCFSSLPKEIRAQLLNDRDPHGNVQVSHIATEQLLIQTVQEELERRKGLGEYGGKFSPVAHFFGYEGRAALPSNFDATYCYSLGLVSALLVAGGLSGYMATLRHLCCPAEQWEPYAVPITSMLCMEKRKGKLKPVIEKSLVDLKGPAFTEFASRRGEWAVADVYRSPGPIQFFGDARLTDDVLLTLKLERAKTYSAAQG